MSQGDSSWILPTVISIVGTLVISLTLYCFSHREKFVIRYPHLFTNFESNDVNVLKIEFWFELIYQRGVRDYYVKKTWLKFNKKVWRKMRSYFDLPYIMGGVVNADEILKLEVGKPEHLGAEYAISTKITLSEYERGQIENMTQKLWHKYKIGWEDSYGKVHWKSISQIRALVKNGVM